MCVVRGGRGRRSPNQLLQPNQEGKTTTQEWNHINSWFGLHPPQSVSLHGRLSGGRGGGKTPFSLHCAKGHVGSEGVLHQRGGQGHRFSSSTPANPGGGDHCEVNPWSRPGGRPSRTPRRQPWGRRRRRRAVPPPASPRPPAPGWTGGRPPPAAPWPGVGQETVGPCERAVFPCSNAAKPAGVLEYNKKN